MWERISVFYNEDLKYFSCSYRLRTTFGWLVKTELSSNAESVAVAQTFLPDTNHEWKLGG